MNISENKKRKLTEGKVFEFHGETYSADEINDAISNYADETYDDWLDEINGDVDICGIKYSASYAFQKVDPIAYNVGASDYESFLWDEV